MQEDTIRALLSLAVAFAMTAILMPIAIPILKRLHFGQSIREDGPTWHRGKEGTPMMGGVVFILAMVTATLIFGSSRFKSGDYRVLISLLASLAFGLIGFADDFIKRILKRNQGFRARHKFMLQVMFAVVYILAMLSRGYISSNLFVPFANIYINLGGFYYIFALIAIVGVVNSLNLIDGLDGLATVSTIPVTIFFAVVAIMIHMPGVAIFSSAMTGALLGFLIYNAPPAKVFMGDTGSLFIGGVVITTAFSLDIPLMILIVGGVYVWEVLSDIIQVVYFKLSGGKRFFRMAPFHHHLELCGWSEKKIVLLFGAVSSVLSIIGYIAMRLAVGPYL